MPSDRSLSNVCNAVDRAHRIGQKKPVQVFRFLTEGTVEEKIIERADRKLFLDAAVIQQGRLAEQHSSLEKDELMKMVRFGADQILNTKGGTYTDEDLDALIAKGEERIEKLPQKILDILSGRCIPDPGRNHLQLSDGRHLLASPRNLYEWIPGKAKLEVHQNFEFIALASAL